MAALDDPNVSEGVGCILLAIAAAIVLAALHYFR